MKNLSKIGMITLMGMSAGLFNACSKPKDGAPGPVGSQGNANVKSYSIDIPLSSFTKNASNNVWESSNAYAIQSNVSYPGPNDATIVYVRTGYIGADPTYTAMPYLDYFSTNGSYNQHSFSVNAPLISVDIRNSGGAQPYTNMIGNMNYKIVVIAGAPGIKAKLPSGVNWGNYSEVKTTYNLN